MIDPALDIARAHRYFAVEYNNSVFDSLEIEDRTEKENDELLEKAHASMIHWRAVGEPINELRAYYMMGYAYAAAGIGDRALHYAALAQAMVDEETDGVTDWDTAFALDAMARAHLAAGNTKEGESIKESARVAGKAIEDKGDRDVFMMTFNMKM